MREVSAQQEPENLELQERADDGNHDNLPIIHSSPSIFKEEGVGSSSQQSSSSELLNFSGDESGQMDASGTGVSPTPIVQQQAQKTPRERRHSKIPGGLVATPPPASARKEDRQRGTGGEKSERDEQLWYNVWPTKSLARLAGSRMVAKIWCCVTRKG